MALASSIGERVETLRARVDRVAAEAGRASGAVSILGVTKTRPRADVVAVIAAGVCDIGENYVQEAREKYVDLPPATKHFIGHVQTNKAKSIVALFDVVQSVDRLDAGLALARAARVAGKALRVLVQVNISPADRFGVAPAGAPELAQQLREAGLEVDGVMAIGPLDGNVDSAFALAQTVHEHVGGRILSLGMSGDWERAIRFGSTMIRIGTAIFGARPLRERVSA